MDQHINIESVFILILLTCITNYFAQQSSLFDITVSKYEIAEWTCIAVPLVLWESFHSHEQTMHLLLLAFLVECQEFSSDFEAEITNIIQKLM
jgi:hypothetical protein